MLLICLLHFAASRTFFCEASAVYVGKSTVCGLEQRGTNATHAPAEAPFAMSLGKEFRNYEAIDEPFTKYECEQKLKFSAIPADSPRGPPSSVVVVEVWFDDGWFVAPNNPAKRGPKPFGTAPHNLKIKEVADSITDGKIIAGGQRPGLPERLISTPGGFKSGRRPDILVQRPDGSKYGINVGRQSRRTGAPIKREAEAISDLEEFGIEMHFVPYD